MSAFLQGIGQVVAGSYAAARLSLALPSDIDVADSQLSWDLIDQQGRVWTQGTVVEITTIASQTVPGQRIISAETQIAVPSTLPANDAGTMYQVRWALRLRTGSPMYSFESFTVLPAFVQAQGASDVIELNGDVARVQIRLPKQYSQVGYEVFRGNNRLTAMRSASSPATDSDGYVYLGSIDPSEYGRASLDPLTVIWSYGEANAPQQRETTQAFIATPVILDAVQDMQTWLNRAYIDSGLQPGTTFQPVDYIKYLRLGRDAFNAAVKPTNFSMTAADGPIRWFWIGYSCAAAARSQLLAEGMKAFDYSGQVVQLNIDRTPFWEQAASAMEGQLLEQVKPFKDNLWKRGNIDGDGSNALSLRRGAVGSAGITIHGLSPLRGMFGSLSPLTPIQR